MLSSFWQSKRSQPATTLSNDAWSTTTQLLVSQVMNIQKQPEIADVERHHLPGEDESEGVVLRITNPILGTRRSLGRRAHVRH
eukprot:2472137-Alexandrium_andersonii.AAC.1